MPMASIASAARRKCFSTETDAIAAIKEDASKKATCWCSFAAAPGFGHGGDVSNHLRVEVSAVWQARAVITDARFSGVSTGACIGHVSPEALAKGPIGKLRDGDLIEIVIDRNKLEGTVNFVGDTAESFAARPMRDDLRADPNLPD